MHRILAIGLAASFALVFSTTAAAWSWPADGEVLRPFALGADAYAAGQHRGVDVAGPEGSAVRAPAAGVVTFAGSLPTYGRGVTILTADGYAVTLVHLGEIGVAKGDSVSEGAAVGSMGTSGTPEHAVPNVHLGIRRASEEEGYVDPLGLLPLRAAPAPAPAPEPVPAPVPVPPAAPIQQPAPPASSPVPAPTPPAPPTSAAPSSPTSVAAAPSATTAPAVAGQATEEPASTASSPTETAAPGAPAARAGISIHASRASAPRHSVSGPSGRADVAPRNVTSPRARASAGLDHSAVASSTATSTSRVTTPGPTSRVVAVRGADARATPRRVERQVIRALGHEQPVDPGSTDLEAAVAPAAKAPAGVMPRSPATALSPDEQRTASLAARVATEPQRGVVGADDVTSQPARRNLLELAAALALAVLLATAVGRRVARRTCLDRALPCHVVAPASAVRISGRTSRRI